MKKNNWFLRIIFILFIVFLGLYIASVSGYYEAKTSDKVALTEEKVKEFEKDVADGKIVDIKTYVDDEYVDYSNTFTKTGDKFSEAVEKLINEGIKGTWDAVKILFF